MKKTLTSLTFVLFTAATASAAPFNFGFETGDTTGWGVATLGGSATVVTGFNDGDGPAYSPYSGSYFLVLETGVAEVDQLVSQPFLMLAGETITGAAAFTTLEAIGADCCLNDVATATIINSGSTVVWSADVATVGQFGSTPWTTWSFTATATDSYILKYTVQNEGDSLYDSYALFDAPGVAAVPDGGSALALLGLGMIGLSTLRRKLF